MGEHTHAQTLHERLAQARRPRAASPSEQRVADDHSCVGHADPGEEGEVAGRYPVVDAGLHEQRSCEERDRLQGDQGEGDDQRPGAGGEEAAQREPRFLDLTMIERRWVDLVNGFDRQDPLGAFGELRVGSPRTGSTSRGHPRGSLGGGPMLMGSPRRGVRVCLATCRPAPAPEPLHMRAPWRAVPHGCPLPRPVRHRGTPPGRPRRWSTGGGRS